MAYAHRRDGKLTGRWVCDAEYKHTDGGTTRWHKLFPTKGEAEGAEACYRAIGNPAPHICAEPTKSFAAVAEQFKARNRDWPSLAQL
jgi:hypothetical protein